jgi:hypothetical protein
VASPLLVASPLQGTTFDAPPLLVALPPLAVLEPPPAVAAVSFEAQAKRTSTTIGDARSLTPNITVIVSRGRAAQQVGDEKARKPFD